MALAPWMVEKNNTLYYKGTGEVIYYVPEKYFELSIATVIGEYVETMGVFPYAVFSKEGKQLSFKHFNSPTMIRCKPSKIEKANNLTLQGTRYAAAYRILHFEDGFELLSQISIPKATENVEKFFNLFMRGNLPGYIPYDEIHEYLLNNADENNFNYKISPQVMGMVISELCRDPDNLSSQFRYTPMDDMTAYKMIAIMKVPKYTSPYTAITSENPDEAIAGAIITTGTGQSPLEKVMMA